jgi:M6 family metalloprotease-like protein
VHIEGSPWSISGWFSIIWGDGPEGESQMGYTLTDDSGQATPLLLDETLAQSLGGVLSFDRKYVSVEGVWAAPLSDQGAPTVLNVTSISLAALPGTKLGNAGVLPAVTGTKPWISIMCKFSDKSAEPKNLAYFQGMYANVKPGLDHFWRQLSYNNVDLIGSNASGWFNLPHTEAYYNPSDTGGGTDLDLLATDCTAAANPTVNFSLYQNGGINMMFNTDVDNGWAWGGTKWMNLDGVAQVWSITWEPPWAYDDISVIQHEMGHGFGLPHSSGAYGATYDNAWDVMSWDRYNCIAATDPTYGCIAQHTISYHKDKLGWIPGGQKLTPTWGSTTTITLEQLGLPTTSNYKMAQIPIGGSGTHFYTVEARRLTGYDIKLAGAAVIIHEVDTTRLIPAHVLDPDLNNNTADAGAMWIAGETFTDATNQISVAVLSATATGFTVRIQLGPVGVPPAAPTPLTPSGSIATGNPTFTWTRPAGVTKWALYVYTTANVVKYAQSVTPTCNASTCSYTPTLNLTAGSYKWAVKAGNASGWSAYSIWKTFALSGPAAPTSLSPSGTITIGNPTFTWTRPASVTKWALYVYTTANVVKFANYVTPSCGASACAYTPTLNLTAGNYKWAVKAGNTYGWSAYSAWLNFTVSSGGSGFDSQFNGSKTYWVNPTGDPTAWFVNSTYLYTAGALNKITSEMYSQSGNENFGTQTFTAKLVRYGCDGCASGLLVRGTPGTLNGYLEWANAYYFMYARNGSYSVMKTVGGTETVLKTWTGSPQINQGTAWNILQVRASGSTLRFYINGCLVWTGTDTSFATGHAGIFMYYDSGSGNTLYVDYATLTTTVSATTQFDTISAEQAALNAAADRQGSTGTSLMAPTPK